MPALFATAALWLLATTLQVVAQQPATPAPTAKPEDGIPISDETVRQACAGCHRADDRQQLSRISFQRNTPEGWQEVIRRMVALNGVNLDPATAREVIRYLSNHLGLAPEEAKPAAFEVERRLPDYKYTANADAENACNKCHSLGRVISQRRTRNEWDLLIAMHRGWYPLVDNQAFRRQGPPPREPGPDGRPPDARHPVEKAVEHLASTFPLKTPEWAAWSATLRPPRLAGTWLLRATELGRGEAYGRMIVTPVAGSPDEFTTEMTYTYARSGQKVARTGRSIVYTGFQWRGRSAVDGKDDAPLREVMFVDRDWRAMEGRWFMGGYDEIGMDVRLERVDSETRILGIDRTAIRAGSRAQEITIFGANLPPGLDPAQIDFGPGVTVARVVSLSGDVATVAVDVADNAVVGRRDIFIAGASRATALAVYDSVDAIRVTPAWAMARVGGVRFPKALAQFEAHAFDNGPDNRPDTPDDVDLGIVDATWSLEEFAATYDDDDVKFVGEIGKTTGLFTPNVDGPNPSRRGERNNIGDVYVVATYTPASGSGQPAKSLRARAHLLVTVPLYMRWEAPGGTP